MICLWLHTNVYADYSFKYRVLLSCSHRSAVMKGICLLRQMLMLFMGLGLVSSKADLNVHKIKLQVVSGQGTRRPPPPAASLFLTVCHPGMIRYIRRLRRVVPGSWACSVNAWASSSIACFSCLGTILCFLPALVARYVGKYCKHHILLTKYWKQAILHGVSDFVFIKMTIN